MMTNIYHDVNKNKVTFQGKTLVNVEDENNKQKMEILKTESIIKRRLLDIFHFGHSGMKKTISEATVIWSPEMKRGIENKVKN